jgi:hypothetical protein
VVAERQQQIDTLREARRLIDIKLNGKPQRKPCVARGTNKKQSRPAPANEFEQARERFEADTHDQEVRDDSPAASADRKQNPAGTSCVR